MVNIDDNKIYFVWVSKEISNQNDGRYQRPKQVEGEGS